MNQLTQQIAGAYIGAQVSGLYKATAADIMQSNIIGMFRLILTPLSAISDEDAVEVARIGGSPYKVHEFMVQSGKELVTECFDRTSTVTGIKWQNIIDYLRSRNYDLGYMHIRSLIDADIAISSTDKTETK